VKLKHLLLFAAVYTLAFWASAAVAVVAIRHFFPESR
jgi:hypothetical protein